MEGCQYKKIIFQKNKILVKYIFLMIFIGQIINIQTIAFFKTIPLSNNNYYTITSNKLYYYDSTTNINKNISTFVQDQIISSQRELEMISFGRYGSTGTPNLLLIKHFTYAVTETGTIHCIKDLTDIADYYSTFIIPIKCTTTDCFYLIGLTNLNKKLYIYLYANVAYSCESGPYDFIIINSDSDNLSCHLISSDDQAKLLCFYEKENDKKIIASNFNIDLSTRKIIQSDTIPKANNGAKIIKSYLTPDKKCFVCFINDDNNGNCFIFDVNNNSWINGLHDDMDYLNDCLPNFSSLNLEYDTSLSEFLLYCEQKSNRYNVVILDNYYAIKNEEENRYYKIDIDQFSNCNELSISSLVRDSSNKNLIKILVNCDNNIIKNEIIEAPPEIKTTIPNIITTVIENEPIIAPSTLIEPTLGPSTLIEITTPPSNLIEPTIPHTTPVIKPIIPQTSPLIEPTIIHSSVSSIFSQIEETESHNENNIDIFQDYSSKTKEEIINNLKLFMEDYDLESIHEIFGDDYKIKISPINNQLYKNISTYINFANCEKKLRENSKYSSSNFSIFQIELYNLFENSLINEVEYAVFDEKKENVDLSACKDEIIEINYEIKNTSLINISKINYYSEQGIDIYNSKDNFFNDICYPYSNEDSDIILQDRITDIYEDYSLCENNCNYKGINTTLNITICECSVKAYNDTIVEEPKLNEIILDTFTKSNIGVIKCYNLVFNIRTKINNIGFWIYTILVLLHIPTFIYYIIYNITSIQKYISDELRKFNYIAYGSNPIKNNDKESKEKKNKNKRKNIKSKKNNINIYNKEKRNKNKIKENISNNTDLSKNISSSLINLKAKSKKSKEKLIIKEKDKNKINDKNPSFLLNFKVMNKNYINVVGKKAKNTTQIENIKKEKKDKDKDKKNKKFQTKKIKPKKIKFSPKTYYLIQMDANNNTSIKPPNSNIILDNYQYETAIKYDLRDFFRILYICILTKEHIFNLILYRTPMNLKILHFSHFLFLFSCDLAFNSIFYSNQNISDKYNYEGENVYYFTMVNNIVETIFSTIVSLVLIKSCKYLIDSRRKYENIFREEENKMRKNRKYKVSRKTKIEILKKINDVSKKFKIKIIIYFILEFSLILFFYYFVTAFCEVYNKTQISWIIDFLLSCLFSFLYHLFIAWVLALLYTLSIRYRLKTIYTIALFIYNI